MSSPGSVARSRCVGDAQPGHPSPSENHRTPPPLARAGQAVSLARFDLARLLLLNASLLKGDGCASVGDNFLARSSVRD